jgi:hypothetical protein
VSGPRIVFVQSPYQNAFFGELTGALAAGLASTGVAVITTTEPDRHDVGADDVFVLMPPHEYVALEGPDLVDDAMVAARTIGISAEQPHQGFFERNAAIGARLGAVLDFSPLAVEAYRAAGVAAAHLPFGYVPEWDRARGATGRRTITTPVLYMGNKRPRRLSVLAAAADALVRHDARLLISDNDEPNRATSPTFVTGEAKRSLLATSGLLVNVHQSDEPYFEWLRVVEAAHCGVPVLSEVSEATAPFVAGTHFLTFERDELARTIDAVAADRHRLDEVARAAYDLLRARPLADSLGVLVAAARRLLAAPPPARLPARRREAPIGRDRTDPAPTARWRRPPLAALRRARWELVAPEGTVLHTGERRLVAGSAGDGAAFVNVLAHGIDAQGAPMLEGCWPWEPWRLLHGQHLGRVLLVDRDVLQAALGWVDDPDLRASPHLAVALFAAAHGLRGAHHPCPAAELRGVAVDPTQAIPPALADRCRRLLTPD